MKTVLDIRHLTITGNSKVLVKDVNLQILQGEILSLVGESGSGKSLTSLSVMQLLPKTINYTGEIYYCGKERETATDICKMPRSAVKALALKEIAYIFQEPMTALNPVQTCGQQLKENLKLCGVTNVNIDAQARKLLDMTELQDHDRILKSYPFQLSGGQRQRVMIAMALAGDPQLIIADEPTTALDIVIQDEILGLLKNICKTQQKSMLFITHDLDAVRQFSDRTAVMYKGEIIESGNTLQLTSTPTHPYTKALIACKPTPDKKGFYLNTVEQNTVSQITEHGRANNQKIAGIDGLSKIYSGGRFKALNNISFDIYEGDSIGLIGESGSGKSTVSKILVNLESPTEGSIKFYLDNKATLPSQVQMVFQDPFASLNPYMTVESMLHEVISFHRKDLKSKDIEREMIDLMVKVGLNSDDLKKYPSNFSGGQRQRLCIARALAVKPKLLICDEATSALDLSVQAQILNLIKQLQISEQLTILMITHSMAVAAWFCNKLVVLKSGEIIDQGPTEVLQQSVNTNSYTRMLLEKSK